MSVNPSAGKKPHSICVVSEDLSLPIDEGIKHFAVSLIQGWSKEHDVLGLSVRVAGQFPAPNMAALKTNRFFLSHRLSKALRRFEPDLICYVPSASATIFSFFRARTLKLFYPDASLVMISLQPRRYGSMSRRLISRLAPDVIYVQNEAAMQQLTDIGCNVRLLGSGVDLDKFTPTSPDRKRELRAKYGLPSEAFTVLHVGHITEGRNIDLLSEVNRRGAGQAILVGSSLIHDDRKVVADRLKKQGVIVIDKYISDIEELYQLADCYLFPVVSDQSCIGTPLSVLEAMSCNLPVVAVRYGLLPRLFKEGRGLFYADTPDGLVECVTRAKNVNGGCRTRENVSDYSWVKIADDILVQSQLPEEK